MKLITFTSIILFVIGSCTMNNPDESQYDLIEIDISKGLRNIKNYPLTHFVEGVELLELESGKGFYTEKPVLWYFGEKYILAYDKSQIQVLLFSRDGFFIRKIGNNGQGPGEYTISVIGTMNKTESKILVVDKYSCNAIIYDLDGKVDIQKRIDKYLPAGVIEAVSWNYNNCIDFLSPRPAKKGILFSHLNQFNSELEFISGINPETTIKDAGQFDMAYYNTFQGTEGSYYWISTNDTVFKYDSVGNSFPAYKLNLSNPLGSKSNIRTANQSNYDDKIFIHSVNHVSNFLVIWMSPHNMQTAVYYDTISGETFSIQNPAECGGLLQGLKTVAIKNDLYGYEPVLLQDYYPNLNICPIYIPFWLPFFEHRADCLKTLDVIHSEIRDQLYEYFRKPDKASGMVLVIHYMK